MSLLPSEPVVLLLVDVVLEELLLTFHNDYMFIMLSELGFWGFGVLGFWGFGVLGGYKTTIAISLE